jgi:rod shape-determining protein MreC
VAWTSANRIIAGTNNIRSTIQDYFHLRKENEALAEENARLKESLALLSNQVESQKESKKEYLYTHLEWDYIPAKVIEISTNKQHNYLTINKGLRD